MISRRDGAAFFRRATPSRRGKRLCSGSRRTEREEISRSEGGPGEVPARFRRTNGWDSLDFFEWVRTPLRARRWVIVPEFKAHQARPEEGDCGNSSLERKKETSRRSLPAVLDGDEVVALDGRAPELWRARARGKNTAIVLLPSRNSLFLFLLPLFSSPFLHQGPSPLSPRKQPAVRRVSSSYRGAEPAHEWATQSAARAALPAFVLPDAVLPRSVRARASRSGFTRLIRDRVYSAIYSARPTLVPFVEGPKCATRLTP